MPQTINPIALEILVILTGLALFLWEAFRDTKSTSKEGEPTAEDQKHLGTVATVGIVALFAVLVLSFFVNPEAIRDSNRFYAVDTLAISFKQFALLGTIFLLIMNLEFAAILRRFIFGANVNAGIAEFLALPIFTCAGLMFMASARDFIMIFVSLELVTMSFYVLVAYMRRNVGSLEAGVKYLILGALSTGFLVYGITWIFGVTGETDLRQIALAVSDYQGNLAPLLFGFALVTVGLGFKIAAVPFQIWVPDVYQGAPTPITAYLSTASKAAGFVVLLRVVESFYLAGAPELQEKLALIFVVLAVVTLLYGNLGAIPQLNLKRLLGYSSIAHAGYLLIGVVSLDFGAVSFYLWAYLLMTMLSFFVIIIVAKNTGGDDLYNFQGLLQRNTLLAGAMIIAMLSLAGLPLTVGFIGKFLIFKAAVEDGQILLCVVGAISVAIGFYYYLKVVWAICQDAPEPSTPLIVSPGMRVLLTILIIAIILFGIFPAPLELLSGPVLATAP